MFRSSLSAIAFGVLLAATATTARAEDLTFGYLPTESSASLKQDWQSVLDDLGKKIGVKVNSQPATDYASLVTALGLKQVQFAWLGNKAAIEAVDRAGVDVFAHTVNIDGSHGYYSMISVHKDSPYKNLDDILKNSKKINFGLGDVNSTSGFVVPNYYVFAKNNITPKAAFASVRNANHEVNILAVANKQVDAAVHASDVMARMEERQPDLIHQLRQVWKSPLIAADPLVWRKDLPDDLKAKIKDFFLAYGKSGPNAAKEKAVLKRLVLGGFQESSNAQLKPIRQLDLFKEKLKIEGDANIGDDDKKHRLEIINRKLAAIEKS